MSRKRNLSGIRQFSGWDRMAFFLFLVTGCFVFWKCRYGFGHIDESFCLTIPYRLLRGDALFQEEWHLSQMAGILTMPVVSAYLSLKGSTEGILLAMRYVCTGVQLAVSVFLYLRLKKINRLGALAAAIALLLYTPFGVMTLSYNSMGILFLCLSQVIMLTAEKRREWQYFLSGLLFAAAVLCCPFLVLVYGAYVVVVAVRFFVRRKRGETCEDSLWDIRCALCVTAGAALAALLFAVFVLSRGSLEKIVRAFAPMLNDPEHLPSPRFEKLRTYFHSIVHTNAVTPYLYTALTGLWFVCRFDSRRGNRKLPYTCVVSALILCLMCSQYYFGHHITKLMWSVNLFGVFLVVLSDDPRMRKVFTTVCVPGLLYSYCLHLASNQSVFAITSASTVASVGSILMIGMFLDEIRGEAAEGRFRSAAAGLLWAVLAVQIGTQTILRYETVFWDKGMGEMTMKMTDGIEKGIITSEDLYYDYYYRLEDLKRVEEYPGQKVLYLSENTWYYLQSEKEMATYSAWLSGVNAATLDRLEIYYEINPHKLPDVVYADKAYLEEAEAFCRRYSYRMENLELGYVLIPA